MAEIQVNNENKDRVFKLIFGGEQKSWTLSLYNAINGSDYSNPDDITVTTLDDAIYCKMKNDVSFLISDTMNFYEHQSTFNPNMPLRMFLYAGGVYSEYVHDKGVELNCSTLRRIPAPKLVVFYNGKKTLEDRTILKLSDAFAEGQKGDIEAEVTMLNINYGNNEELLGRCRPLCDYSIFVSTVRQLLTEGETMADAVHLAIRRLADDSPIKEYLLNKEAQVKLSCLTEFNAQLHDEAMREEGRDIQARYTNDQMRSAGLDIEQRSKMLGLPVEELSEWDKDSQASCN